jgi:hypothetical protein
MEHGIDLLRGGEVLHHDSDDAETLGHRLPPDAEAPSGAHARRVQWIARYARAMRAFPLGYEPCGQV